MLALDRDVFGADRGPVLRWAFGAAPDLAWRTAGGAYCFGRHGDHSDHVGPVVAEDREGALALVARVPLAPAPPAADPRRASRAGLARRLAELGFREQRPFTRMFLGDARPAGSAGAGARGARAGIRLSARARSV